MNKVAMAVAAHPDDIEIMMAGTLILLKQAGCEIHYMNVANGSCGSMTMSKEETIATRTVEAENAAALVGATFHPPLVDDIDVLYEQSLISKLCAIVREVNPRILLLPSPQDYMEDHQNASRLMVTAAFCRNMPNYTTDPPTPHIESEMCLYNALPFGLVDQLRIPVRPDFFVDIHSILPKKREMLACHKSQKEWLDESQGHDNYLKMMEEQAELVGQKSGTFAYAEGWRKHSHLGFGSAEFDPLHDLLPEYITSSGELPHE